MVKYPRKDRVNKMKHVTLSHYCFLAVKLYQSVEIFHYLSRVLCSQLPHNKNRQCRDAHTEKCPLSVLEWFLHIRLVANLGGKILLGKTKPSIIYRCL